MQEVFDPLVEDVELRRLLAEYRGRKSQNPEAEWYDRVMRVDELEPDRLTVLHGTLIARGWLEVRVHQESLAATGELKDCYRPSRNGIAALRRAEQPFGLETESGPLEDW